MVRRPIGGVQTDRLLQSGWLKHVEYHSELRSTNETARELLQQLLLHAPAVVLADHQTAGRGRQENTWWSSAGALTFSVVIDPETPQISATRRPLISLAAGLAVCDAISPLLPGKSVRIKWPNDVYIGSQKVCGILSEQHAVAGVTGVIIGVGMNVNNSLAGAPDDVRQRAVSLFDLQQQSYDLTSVLASFLNSLPLRLQQIVRQPVGLLAEANSLHLLNQCTVTVRILDNTITGQCVGIDEDGCLVLRTTAGICRITSGSILEWHVPAPLHV